MDACRLDGRDSFLTLPGPAGGYGALIVTGLL